MDPVGHLVMKYSIERLREYSDLVEVEIGVGVDECGRKLSNVVEFGRKLMFCVGGVVMEGHR